MKDLLKEITNTENKLNEFSGIYQIKFTIQR